MVFLNFPWFSLFVFLLLPIGPLFVVCWSVELRHESILLLIYSSLLGFSVTNTLQHTHKHRHKHTVTDQIFKFIFQYYLLLYVSESFEYINITWLTNANVTFSLSVLNDLNGGKAEFNRGVKINKNLKLWLNMADKEVYH